MGTKINTVRDLIEFLGDFNPDARVFVHEPMVRTGGLAVSWDHGNYEKENCEYVRFYNPKEKPVVEYEKGRKERMRDELKELSARVQKLHEFLGIQSLVNGMPTDKLDLLMKQYHYMTMYEHVLRLRLNMEDEEDGN